MVLDREALRTPPAYKFSYEELEAILEACKGDEDIKKGTVAKLNRLVIWSRTKYAYQVQDITLTAS